MNKKRILSGILATVMLTSLSACNNSSSNGGETMINIMNTGGGVGRIWLDNAIARYQKENPNVVFNVEHNLDTGVGTMRNSGYSIYFVEQGGIANLAASGKLLKITDLLTETNEQRNGEDVSILDKIKPETRAMLKGFDGEYYALPHFTLFSGLSYDAELFTSKGYYFADYSLDADGQNVIEHDSAYGKAKFVAGDKTDVKKSVGNDGISGTYDDGLPTTLKELCILCDRMKRTETDPIELNGTVTHYISNVIKGLWASLSGYEQMKVTYSFDGELDCVTGYETGTPLMQGITSISKPQVETKTVTEATGYLAYSNVAKYYATSFVELIKEKGYLSNDYTSNTLSPGVAQLKFICNGYNAGDATYGMLVEGTHWYNEAINNSSFKTYDTLSGKKNTAQTRDIRWMPLPTSLETPVTGVDNARKYTMAQASDSYAFVNANIAGNENLTKEVKKFLAFLYTDAELSHFTGETGVLRGFMDYELLAEDEAQFAPFERSVIEMYEKSDVIFNAAENDTFLRNSASFSIVALNKSVTPTVDGVAYSTYIDALGANKKTKDIFEATQWTKAQWEASYYVAE